MFVDRLSLMLGSRSKKRDSTTAVKTEEPLQETDNNWMTTVTTTIGRYPKTFLGIGLVAGVAIGWLIKRR